ncbi:uncharacterized protein LOC135490370 [Lineus longissimus]|uniref:uncharacterized protein LOC135490370 n=1 Tax=Lineus longissimus TaxID=88925 RepID=UPI00315C6386
MFRVLMVVFLHIIVITNASHAKQVGDICKSHAECNSGENPLHHSKCEELTCQCVAGYFGETNDAICAKPVLDDSCENKPPGYCSAGVANSECNKETKSCECEENYVMEGVNIFRCIKVESGSPCDPDADTDECASSGIAGLSCDQINEECSCKKGYVVSDKYSACVKLVSVPADKCPPCYETNGRCIDLDENGKWDDCICPANKQMSDPEALDLGCNVGLAEIGDFCDEAVICYRENSDCVESPGLSKHTLCACNKGYTAIPIVGGNGDQQCVHAIDTRVDPNCETCEGNGGACYDRDGDTLRDGCHCPHERSSSDPEDYTKDCNLSMFAVDCHPNSMEVRFTPFNDSEITSFDLYEGEATVYIEGKQDKEPCVFESNGNDSWSLNISLKNEELKQCGTRRIHLSGNKEHYENRVWIRKISGQPSKSDLCFDVYCSYETKARASSADLGRGVAVIWDTKKSKAGKRVKQDVSLEVQDEHGRDATIVGAKLGSRATIIIAMVPEEAPAYVGMNVENCVASTEPSPTSPTGASVLMIRDGCPVKGFNISIELTDDNTRLSIAFRIFLIGTGKDDLFFHCSVNMCRENGQCARSNCTDASRRRRMALSPTPQVDLGTLTESLHSRAVRVLPSDKFYTGANKERVFYSEGEKQEAFFSTQMVTITIAVLLSVIVTIAIVAVAVILVIRKSAAVFQSQLTPQPSPPPSEC